MICFAMRGVSSIGEFFEARAYIKPVLGVISMYTIIELILKLPKGFLLVLIEDC